VGEDDEGAHGGGEVGVGIGVGGVEVLGEILGFLEFSNVVIEAMARQARGLAEREALAAASAR